MEVQPLQRRLERREEPDGEPDASRASEHVDPAAHPTDCSREIMGAALEELGPLFVADHLAGQGGERGGRHRIAGDVEIAPDAQRGWHATLQMDVARTSLAGEPDDVVEDHGEHLWTQPTCRSDASHPRSAPRL